MGRVGRLHTITIQGSVILRVSPFRASRQDSTIVGSNHLDGAPRPERLADILSGI
jgi:hypothetical protein